MLLHYLKLAWRSLIRRRFYAALNLVGLSLGLGCMTMVLLYLDYETSYDDYFEPAGQVYRLHNYFRASEYPLLAFDGYHSAPREEQLRWPRRIRQMPQVEAVTHMRWANWQFGKEQYAMVNDRRMVEDKLMATNLGPEWLRIFPLRMIAGDPVHALDRLHSLVIEQSTAERYFGSATAAMGRTVTIDTITLLVTGVAQDIPGNVHFDLSGICTLEKIPYWGAYTYFKVKPGTDVAHLTKSLEEQHRAYLGDTESGRMFKGLRAIALADIHLKSDALYELKPPGDARYLYIFGLIGGLVLLITLTNYINLSIALYSGRNREIALRKVSGAQKRQLLGQFLFEAILLCLIALPIGLGLCELLLPAFNQLMGLSIANNLFTQPGLVLSMLGIATLSGLIAGLYPALYLSRQDPVNLFRNQLSGKRAGLRLRQVLVAAQFVMLIGLGSTTLLVQRQLHFIQNKDLGFTHEGVLKIEGTGAFERASEYEVFLHELEQMPAVLATGAGGLPGRENFNNRSYRVGTSDRVYRDANEIYTDRAYFDVIEVDLPRLPGEGDTATTPDHWFLVNEAFAKARGLRDPVGTTLRMGEDDDARTERIAGVVRDIHYFSLKEAVRPQFYHVIPAIDYAPRNLVLRVHPAQVGETIARIESLWQELGPENQPFGLTILDERIAELYDQERRIGQLSNLLVGLAILLALLGLVGLTAFLTRMRYKEIGIRKVLGASRRQILLLLNREFWPLVGVALLLATPLALWGAQHWLESFAYRAPLGWWVFPLTGSITWLISAAVISLHGLGAARQNPARVLRDE